MATLAGGEVRHHELEVVAAAQQHEPALLAELTASRRDQLRQFGLVDHAVAGDQGRRGVVVAPGSHPDVERHRHGGRR